MSKDQQEDSRLLVQEVRRDRAKAAAQCELGAAAVCLWDAKPSGVRRCIGELQVVRVVASRWPIFQLLADLQRKEGAGEMSCDDVEHPSLEWAEWRARVQSFVEKVPPWLEGKSESDMVPDEYNEAVSDAQGVVWKASSSAVAEGRTIGDWTALCSFGVLSAHAIRASGLVLGNGDVYRIVERAMESAQTVLMHAEEVLQSAWPLFGVLHALSLMKNALHDTRLTPSDLSPLGSPLDETSRSPTWQAAARGLRAAASAGGLGGPKGTVLLTILPHHRVNFLLNYFKHADRLGFLAPVAVVPSRENLTEACESIAVLFAAQKADAGSPMPAGWSPCLPFVSMFVQRAQYLYLHVALQLDLAVLWFDFHVVWIKSPLNLVRQALSGSMGRLPYSQPCDFDCKSEAEPEVYLAEEFYQRYWPRNALVLLRPTDAVRRWIEPFTRWLCTYPYASVVRGLHYFAYPGQPDAVPSMSFLPAIDKMPRVALGHLDVEQEFIGFDGWFGNVDNIVSFEVGGFIQESDRVLLLDKLLMGKPEEIRNFLMHSRKVLSPLRPTQRLYQRFFDGNSPPKPCEWERVPRAYIGGYAADVETVFWSREEAKCKCILLGSECGGITCEAAEESAADSDAAGLVSCTVRHGDPPLATSPVGEESHVKHCADGGCDAPPIERIVHVNFADGCCEAEQKQSSETAQQFGADESRPLRGDFLDEDFKQRNHKLLTFNRTPELTQHKTPSGKIGYYVWKPYVILKTVQDPELPWETTVIAWTDAGIYFVDDMRPLIHKYLRSSDVSATRTPMLEGDFSKRDAFILLDADYQTIMETNQVATGIILVRKTQLAIQFLEKWLRACEEPRIMTEEPSVMGMPDYFSYKNNNDDQTAFSLLFKRYGFAPFSAGERDAVVYTGRNLAKFIKASDDFAVGRKSDREAYLRAADDAAKQGPQQRSE